MREPSEKAAPVARLAFRVRELAAALGVPTSTLYNRIKSGDLRAVRLGEIYLIPVGEVERVLSGGDR